jgi:hypothetical protein
VASLVTSDVVFANLAHPRPVEPSAGLTVGSADLLAVHGVYQQWLATRQIRSPAIVRREVSWPR